MSLTGRRVDIICWSIPGSFTSNSGDVVRSWRLLPLVSLGGWGMRTNSRSRRDGAVPHHAQPLANAAPFLHCPSP